MSASCSKNTRTEGTCGRAVPKDIASAGVRPPSLQRVVITGIGLVTPAGTTLAQNWSHAVEGRSALSPIAAVEATAFPVRVGGQIKNFRCEPYVKQKKIIRYLRKDVQYCLAAAHQALADARLPTADGNAIGLFVGSGETQTCYNDFFPAVGKAVKNGQIDCNKFGTSGIQAIYPSFLLFDLYNNGLCYLSIEHQLAGANNNFTFGAAGGHAIGEAFRAIQQGEVTIALAGGHDSLLSCFENLFLYSATGLLTRCEDPERALRPFSAGRDGFAPAEGAAFVVLESLENALSRGAGIRAELLGYGFNCDLAPDLLAADPQDPGLGCAIQAALRDAGLAADQIDHINAQGFATLDGDRYETAAYKQIFGKHAYRIPICTLSPVLGYAGAAAAAIDLAFTVLSMERSIVPPTLNYEGGDPDCDLDYVPHRARSATMRYTLCVNKGLGGQNCVFALGYNNQMTV
jgi:3-oxoacyl-[acyl-carrier-protein] synthase II